MKETFEKLRPLDGASGRVWLALDRTLRRHVALKFQAGGEDGPARAALIAETGILARCDHPSIVRFYQLIPAEPPVGAFYAMKAMTSSLSDRLSATEPLPEATVRRIGREIASALAHMHGLSPAVVHGNVRPEHILFDIGDRPALAGFGSARAIAYGDSAATAEDILALGKVLEAALASGGRHIPREWRPLLNSMLAEDAAARPSAAEVAKALADTPPINRTIQCLVAACAIAAVATAAACICKFALVPDDAVVDEVKSPLFSSISSIQPRLPQLSPAAVRRIPWYCHINDVLSSPEAQSFKNRLNEFRRDNPEWRTEREIIFTGMLRTIRLPGDVQLELTAIPWGIFRRGFFLESNLAERAETFLAPDSVFVSRPFWMTRTEITRAQYAAVMRLAPAVAGLPARKLRRGEGRRGQPLELEGGDMPVGEDLDLADVLSFIDALNALCGLEGDRRFRLPTEAEWEHACRAFTGRHYEGERNPGDAAWTAENSEDTPHPVAGKAQNPFGLFDMHGNLAEWCADAYGPLEALEPVDPIARPSSNSAPRVLRGGSFRDAAALCDSDTRVAAAPAEKGHAIRLVAWP